MKQKTLIFHVGCSAGFFSEYLEMMAAIVYCKLNNIQFKLYSKDANFGHKNGWTDFFEPFCEEVTEDFHSKYNLRFKYPSLTRLIIKKILKNKNIPTWCWKKLSLWYLKVFLTAPYYKTKYQFYYYTHDLWTKIQNNKTKQLEKYYKEVEIKAINDTWRLNPSTQKEVDKIIKNLNLPDKFIGTQVRAGDKSTEQLTYHFTDYLNKIDSLQTNIKDIFILTDDYSIITDIKSQFPQYRIFTLCNENEKGYDNDIFQNQNKDMKKSKLINLIASVEILWKSEILVGAIIANPSLFLYLRQHQNSYWLNA
ncbi:MAG: hypothetical protein ACOYMA_15180 [Bacteroidia bacterium]